MKKHGISKRILAMMLVLCMVFTMMPANVNAAATHPIDTVGTTETGLNLNEFNYEDYSAWPIEIYDYENDGMLFEYAGATGNGNPKDKPDKNGEYVYMPDLTTDYYANYTNPIIDDSYVVNNRIKAATTAGGWGLIPDIGTNTTTNGMRYYIFNQTFDADASGGTELIDFRDANSDAVEDSYGASTNELGDYTFGNAYGYQFTINDSVKPGFIDAEDTIIVDTQSAYDACGPDWAISVHLRPTGNSNEYSVVKVVSAPGSATAADITLEDDDIVLVVHSSGSQKIHPTTGDTCSNWKSKVAALALKSGEDPDTITLSSDGKTATVNVPEGKTEPNEQVNALAKDVQYAVLVYRTTNLDTTGDLEVVLRDSNPNIKYWGTNKPISASGTTSDWSYIVLGFLDGYTTCDEQGNEGSRLDNWKDINTTTQVQSAGIRFTTSDAEYEFMISHFAMFETEGEAEAYGEKALVYNKHYIYEVYPEAEYSSDFSTKEIDGSKLETYWFNGVYKMTEQERSTQGIDNYTNAYSVGWDIPTDVQVRSKYYSFSNPNTDELELIDFSDIGGIEKNKANYAVLVFRLYDTSITNIRFQAYLREKSVGTTYGDKKHGVLSTTTYNGEGLLNNWKTVVLDLSNVQWDDAEKVYSAGIKMEGKNALSKFEIDITQFALFEDEGSAENYAREASNYIQYTEAPTAYYNPIYSNLGYGLLVGSHNNPLYPEKYSERIGYTFIPAKEYNADGTETGNTYFEKAYSSLADQIYFLAANNGSNLLHADVEERPAFSYNGSDMSTLPFDGYNLLTTLTEGSMTAGLLEGTLTEDGNPVYREEVVDYLANLLATTLTIPEYKNGRFNYDFIRGEESQKYAGEDGKAQDLASAIRDCVEIDFDENDTVANDTVTIGENEYDVEKLIKVETGKQTLTRTINGESIEATLELDKTEYKAGVLAAMISGQAMIDETKLKGKWDECKKYIYTYYDAAYYLLNTIFIANSYNEAQTDYEYLALNKTTTTEGEDAYVFDAGFSYTNAETESGYESALNYDKGMINFAKVENKAVYYYADDTPTTLFPFLPIRDHNDEEGMTKSPYFEDDGVATDRAYGGTYWKRDFNYVMKASGVFTYHSDKDLFFEFEGDDDVYLFINGHLVLDIGGAHSITKVRFDLEDYVNAAKEGNAGSADRNKDFDLEDNDICTFEFFYMERHGYGANCRIATNMNITDPALVVKKEASQNDVPLNYGDSVNPKDLIAYDFVLENVGDVKLHKMIFNDANIGVKLDYENGLTIHEDARPYVKNKDGDPLKASDLTAEVIGYREWNQEDGSAPRYSKTATGMKPDENGQFVAMDTITAYFEEVDGDGGNAALIKFMDTLYDDKLSTGNSAGDTNAGDGVWAFTTVKIKGIYYQMTEEQIQNKRFDNHLDVSAETMTEGQEKSKTLHSSADHRVYISNELTYYQWAGEQLVVDNNKLKEDLAGAGRGLTVDKIKGIKLEGNTGEVTYENGEMTIKYAASALYNFNVVVDHKSNPLDETEKVGVVDIPITYGATINDKGDYVFENAYGYKFNIDVGDKKIDAGDTIIVDTQSAYDACGPDWAISVHIRPTGTQDKYEVVQVVTGGGSLPQIKMAEDDIVMVVHSLDSKPENDNWMSKVAAMALKDGDIVTVSDDMTTVTVDSEQTVPVKVIVTDVKDSAYVLDYGLSVNMTEDGSLFANDKLTVEGHDTKSEMLAISNGDPQPSYANNNIVFNPVDKDAVQVKLEGSEGTFELAKASQSLTYTPTEFMDAEDSLYVAVLVRDEKYNGDKVVGTVNINKEVQMYKEVSVLPANVVYYEDDFPAIHYKDANDSYFTPVNSFYHEGSSAGLTQSTDQEQEYGQDDAYSKNDVMSGNSLTKIKINAHGQVAYFDFTGTGLELIGQTNAKDSAIFSMQVKELFYDGEGKPIEGNQVRNIPVITELDNNADGENDSDEDAIYQVPVIRINDLPHGTYRVYISGIASKDFTQNPATVLDTYLYIDGIRIFQPLEKDSDAVQEHYNKTEKDATFAEIRDLILNGQAAVATYSKENDEETSEEKFKVSTGTVTWTENRNNTFEGNSVSSANDYLMFGPNNEVYMAKDSTNEDKVSALIFYVNKKDGAENPNLQIAFRAIDAGLYMGEQANGNEAEISYGIKYADKSYWTEAIVTKTATEQYYTIDYTKCPYIDNKGYQVAIKVNEGMISYTSLKYNGLELANLNAYQEGEIPSLIYKDGVLVEKSSGDVVDGEVLPEFDDLKLQFIAKDTISFDELEEGLSTDIRYQTRNNKDVRLIAYVENLSDYESVSFQLSYEDANGETVESKLLKCTTAYNKLYAGDVPKTTEEIFDGKKGYFVTFTINNYLLSELEGKEITIKAIYDYTDSNLSDRVEKRDVTIEKTVVTEEKTENAE